MLTRFQMLASAGNSRSYLAALLVAAAGLLVTSCGGGDGGVGPASTLTVALAGSGHGTVTSSVGGISCTNANATGSPIGSCQGEVADNGQVTLSATAETGSTFVGWTGNGVSCGASTPCTITVPSALTVTATFEAASATRVLTVVGGGSGSGQIVSDPQGIDCTITGGTEGDTGCSNPFATGTPVELQVESGSLVGWGGACSGASCSVVMDVDRTVIANLSADAPATQLAFVVQPSAVQTGHAIAPPVQVAVQDETGQTVASRTDAITLQIGTNPGGATLGGQITRNAVNGVATFSDLTLSLIGDNYTLVASTAGLPNVTSAAFNVSAEPVAQLAFSVQPTTAQAGASINPAVKVEIRDAQGAILTGRTDQITVSLQNNPGGATLGGATTATAIAGVATFSNLTVPKVATGYTLGAGTPNASGATSNGFDIVPGPAKQMVLIAGQSQEAPIGTNVPVRPSVEVLDAFNNPVPDVPITWEVTSGGGSVVASVTDPKVRPTGPLGLSTAVSWTLGTDAGTNNNELRATATGTGITGNPITFTASGIIPAGQGIFNGLLKRITNAGFVDPAEPIANAFLTFLDANTQQPLGTATSKGDGTFISPPLPAGTPYQINVTAADFKAISFARPALSSGATFPLGPLGMVPFSDAQGTAFIGFSVKLSDVPANSVKVHVFVFRGYFVGVPDEVADAKLILRSVDVDTDAETGRVDVGFDPLGDWGLLTVRVSAPGYLTQDRLIVVDDPLGQIGPCDANHKDKCNKQFKLIPVP